MKKGFFFSVLLAVMIISLLMSALADPLPEMQLHQIAMPRSANAHVLISGNTVILIDCGADSQEHTGQEPLFRYLRAIGIDHMDAHIVTHYHNDHALFIDDLSEAYGTKDTIVYGPSPKLPSRFLPLPNSTYKQLLRGDKINIGPFAIECIGPLNPGAGELNVNSLNFTVTYGETVILFTGDFMDFKIRQAAPEAVSSTDILIFPHHGLRSFSIDLYTFKKFLRPKLVLIPGRGKGYVREYLLKSGQDPEIHSTDEGHIVVLSDGVTFETHVGVKPGTYRYQLSK